jgi:hypothetical protein
MIYGDYFFPKKIIKKLRTNLVVEEFKNRGDIIDKKKIEFWQYGFLNIIHYNDLSNVYPDEKYEEEFVIFIEDNYELLKISGADSIEIMIDVYYKNQCNFEIFNKKNLRRLSKYDVSLPISVYHEK